jgi:hypothetical protein
MKHEVCLRDDVILWRCETGSRTASLQGWIYGVSKIIRRAMHRAMWIMLKDLV